MNILVIGGTGFIGEYLCRALLQEGSKVMAVSRPETDKKEKIDGVRYEEIDLDINFLELKRIISEVDKIVFAVQPNIKRMQNIISVIQEFDNVKKIIYLSTLLVYPDSIYKQDEKVFPHPRTDYEKTKYEEEELLVEFVKNKNCHLCIARLGNVYGDIKNRGVVNNILLSLVNNQDFYLDGDGRNLRDYIFVEDVARLLVGLIKINSISQVEKFNVCSGKEYSIMDLVSLLEEVTGKKLKILNIIKTGKSKSVVGDSQKIVETLKLIPQYSLTEGLKKTYNNYSNYYKSS